MSLRNSRESSIPQVKPDPRFLIPEDVTEGLRRREADIQDRKARFEQAISRFKATFPDAEIMDRVWSSGKVLARFRADDTARISIEIAQSAESDSEEDSVDCALQTEAECDELSKCPRLLLTGGVHFL